VKEYRPLPLFKGDLGRPYFLTLRSVNSPEAGRGKIALRWRESMPGKVNQFMGLLEDITRKVSVVCATLGAGCVFFLIIWGMVGIFLRFIFNYAMPGHFEGSILFLVLIVYLSIAYTQFEKGHIRMGLFVSRFKGRSRDLIEAFGLFICLIPSTILLWRTGKEAFRSFTQSEFQMGLFSFPTWPSRTAIPVGFLLVCLCLVVQIWRYLKSSEGSKSEQSISTKEEITHL
jgi:TRAP-type mannitol/chloroaromatic compound transport system permease small subunit